ncbi:MAG: hypothetical protein KGN01_06400 [Patescibacteria group bacterium]|nr:hypothetical protein [Patescibacteria group bacterium]
MFDELSDKVKAELLLAILIASTIIYYFANNPYEIWSETANPLEVFVIYYTISQPIYIGFILLYTERIYDQDYSLESALRGFFSAITFTIGADLTGLPFGFLSITNPSGTLQLIPNPATSSYADTALASFFAGPSGVVTFWIDIVIHILIPSALFIITYIVSFKHEEFIDLVSRG